FDPHTREALTELEEVGSGVAIGGVVVTWTWVPEPTDVNPHGGPFAWALVRLDGADTALLLPLAADGPEAVSTGMRVRLRWAAERVGSIHDIACVVAEDTPLDDDEAAHPPTPATGDGSGPVSGIV